MPEKEENIVGEFVAVQSRFNVRGPWGLFSRTPPFASYIDKVFRRERVRRNIQHTSYMGRLLDSKAGNDIVVFDEAQSILREIRGVPRWLTWIKQKRDYFRARYRDFKRNRWPAFRRTVGF